MSHPKIAIIGSGFSGMATAIQLQKRLNITADMFESTKDIGGTWNYNQYPGCACDIPSHLYSFSFELNPNWSQAYSGQKEIHEYMQAVARKYNLYEQTQFQTEVIRASWKESEKKWEIELRRAGQDQTQIKLYDYIFSGVGAIRVPNIPEQFKSFDGKIIHSAYWDTEYDFTNKKVAVVGSGTSSVQIIPKLSTKAAHLYNYLRTPAWVIPRNQHPYSNFTKKLFTYFPILMYLYRSFFFLFREARFGIWGNANSWLAKGARLYFKNEMKKIILAQGRPDLLSKLIPTYAPGCKRVGISDDYLQALCRDNVTVNCSPIQKVEGKTIYNQDGTQTEVDVLCLATGFDVNGFLGHMQVYGRNGVSLNKLWEEESVKTYKTVNVHGFPNLFIMLGPGSGLGHNSVVSMIECQVDYSITLLEHMLKNKITCMDPTEKAQEKFITTLQRDLKGTTWLTGCNSWYQSKKGQVQFLWPKTVISFYFNLKKTNYEQDYIKN